MIPAAFEYHKAKSLRGALGLLTKHEDAKILSGGHSLLPAMKLRMSTPERLIDIGGLKELRYLRAGREFIRVGANSTHRELASSKRLAKAAPALAQAAGSIGDIQVRNRGTVGGSIAHADPAADYPAVLLALNATINVRSAEGDREIPIDDYFIDLFMTNLNSGEIITEVTIPVTPSVGNSCYLKFPHPASRFAVCGCAVAADVSGGTWSSLRVAYNGISGATFRDQGIEQALEGQAISEDSIRAASDNAAAGAELMGDTFASEEYRRHLAQVFARRALTQLARG